MFTRKEKVSTDSFKGRRNGIGDQESIRLEYLANRNLDVGNVLNTRPRGFRWKGGGTVNEGGHFYLGRQDCLK